MTKWTKGPYRANGTMIMAQGSVDTVSEPVWASIGQTFSSYGRENDPIEIQDSEGRFWSTSGTPAANAQLFAAAPELYEALEGIQSHAEEMIIDIAADMQAGGSASEELRKWNAVIAALLKARGKS